MSNNEVFSKVSSFLGSAFQGTGVGGARVRVKPKLKKVESRFSYLNLVESVQTKEIAGSYIEREIFYSSSLL